MIRVLSDTADLDSLIREIIHEMLSPVQLTHSIP